MSPRSLRAVLIAAALTAAAVSFLLLRPDGDETRSRSRTTIEQALAGFTADQFGVAYVATCPQEFPADGEISQGVCSARFSEADGRVVYRVGQPFSEWVGEATLVRDAFGSWSVTSFEEYPPLGG